MSVSKSSMILHPYVVKMFTLSFLLFLSHSTKVLGVVNASKNSKYVKSFSKVYSR